MAGPRASPRSLALAAALGAGGMGLAMGLAMGPGRDDAARCPRATPAAADAAGMPRTAPAPTGAVFVPAGAAAVATRTGARADVPPPGPADPGRDAERALKSLLAPPAGAADIRGKLAAFLDRHRDRDGVAVASRGVFELADNPVLLPDTAIAALYLEREEPDIRRVLAQVASMRGDNRWIELHVAETALGLHASEAAQRQQALVELARTRHAAAADLALPMLADHDTGVVLDALLALRATGNQRHAQAVSHLRGHPDEAVRWLARDVAAELRMLSGQARTRVAGGDLMAELPALPAPAIACGRAGHG